MSDDTLLFNLQTDSSVFSQVGADLAQLPGWKVSRPGDVKADLWIADGRKKNAVPYALLGQEHAGRSQLLNYARGSACLTLKSSMVRTLIAHNAESLQEDGAGLTTFPAYLPETYIVYPKTEEEEAGKENEPASSGARAAGGMKAELERRRRELRKDERGAFLAAHERNSGSAVWIAKGSAGMGGNGIEIGRDAAALLAAIDGSGKDTAWVVCRYIERPLLLAGRKFDIRAWALLAPGHTPFIFEEGVARTSSFRYDLDDLGDRRKHLTNHCIQCETEEYSKFEAGNELSFQ